VRPNKVLQSWRAISVWRRRTKGEDPGGTVGDKITVPASFWNGGQLRAS
jgi:hypothetical protein